MLATNEGVPLPLLWCIGAAVMYAMVQWSNQKRSLVAPCKGRLSRFPCPAVPLIGPEHSILHIIPHHIHGTATAGHAASPQSWTSSVSELHSTRWRPTEIDQDGDLPS